MDVESIGIGVLPGIGDGRLGRAAGSGVGGDVQGPQRSGAAAIVESGRESPRWPGLRLRDFPDIRRLTTDDLPSPQVAPVGGAVGLRTARHMGVLLGGFRGIATTFVGIEHRSADDRGMRVMSSTGTAVGARLSTLDRFLPAWIGIAMAAGLSLGRMVPGLGRAVSGVEVDGISLPIAIGLLVMMYPVLARVRYDKLGRVTDDRRLMLASVVLNWLIGPAVMFALAWLMLPDLPEYRTG